jgi:hypothetical protein
MQITGEHSSLSPHDEHFRKAGLQATASGASRSVWAAAREADACAARAGMPHAKRMISPTTHIFE